MRLLIRPALGSKMPDHKMPSTTPGNAHGRMRIAMTTPRPRNGCCSSTAVATPSTVDSVTPMTT
jgi:hypothetical protein